MVTSVKSGGFFLQSPDGEADADPATSEGLFVYGAGTASFAISRGALLSVTGTVAEYRPASDPASPPMTELTGWTAVELQRDHPLPEPVEITSTDDLERFEGMRVRVPALTAISGTDSSGVFFGVLEGTPRPFREPGIPLLDPLPEGAPPGVRRFDGNPERLRVDSNGQRGARRVDLTSGATVRNLVGPLDYGARAYTILPDPDSPPQVCCLASAEPVTAPAETEFTVASLNLHRFTSDPKRLQKASLAIRRILRAPDILGVQEVDTIETLEALARRIDLDALAAREPAPGYLAYLAEGNDPGGIDVGLLVGSRRVEVISVAQEGFDAAFNDRPPLILRARLGWSLPVTVVVNHLRSLLDIEQPRVQAKRKAQAEFLAGLIQSMRAENLIVLGDFNSFQFNDGYIDVMGTIAGAPAPSEEVTLPTADLVEPDLVNLIGALPEAGRYSYVYQGDAQAIDHILVSASLLPHVSRFAYVRLGADFPESWSGQAARPERLTDHDAALAQFTILPATSPPD